MFIASRLGIQIGQSVSAPQWLGPQLENLRLEQLRVGGGNFLKPHLFTCLALDQDDSKTRAASQSACTWPVYSVWASSHHGHLRVVRLEDQGSNNEYSFGKDRSCTTLHNPASGVTNHHSHFILLVETILSRPRFKGRSHGP